ncbi:MAG: exosortase-associated EpsI family protein [Phycisphaerales bacterium]
MAEGARVETSRRKRGRWVAAPLTAVVLAGMAAYSLASIRPGGASDAYFRQVSQAIDALPMQIEGYIGRDRPPLPAAIEMLRPNRLVQREYADPVTGESFSVLIVHCGDVRDMMGHYPPICYPSNGWEMDGTEAEEIVRTEGSPIPITRYRVSRGDESMRLSKVIANTFVVPRADSPLGRDDRALDSVTRTRWSSGLGAAQVQIITDSSMDAATRERIERSVADRLAGLIRAVANSEGVPEQGEGP